MNNTTSTKSTRTTCETPKTPGGISKSLLTPCRRVGLSRNWKKSGISPFVSPLSSSGENSVKSEAVIDKKPSKTKVCSNKKDKVDENDQLSHSPRDAKPVTSIEKLDLVETPTRAVDLLRKSRSKTLISTISCNDNVVTQHCEVKADDKEVTEEVDMKAEESVSKPVKKKSMKISKTSPQKSVAFGKGSKENKTASVLIVNQFNNISPPKSFSYSVKEKSPNNLTKECIVVIQRKINKNAINKTENIENVKSVTENKINPVSQALFDSDSDETPLSIMTKKTTNEEKLQIDSKKRLRESLDEDEFYDNKTVPNKVKKIQEKINGDLKLKLDKNTAKVAKKPIAPIKIKTDFERQSSQGSNSFNDDDDDDDDFDFDRKRTIIIRKTYDKVIKPAKAKSTGSVTQKDIDDLKARIEMKKNMLLAKAMTKDTADLRFLIKKWKKGCQDALIELMDLMKTKFPDRQHMNYSEMLQMLKIPSTLVGYNSDDESFTSPTDTSIILEKFI